MVREKMMPSVRPYKPRSDEAMFVVFLVRWPRRRVFWNTIYVSKAENDIDTTGWHRGAEKTTEKRGSRRPEAYTEGFMYTIL
jgi:hypothetical protein